MNDRIAEVPEDPAEGAERSTLIDRFIYTGFWDKKDYLNGYSRFSSSNKAIAKEPDLHKANLDRIRIALEKIHLHGVNEQRKDAAASMIERIMMKNDFPDEGRLMIILAVGMKWKIPGFENLVKIYCTDTHRLFKFIDTRKALEGAPSKTKILVKEKREQEAEGRVTKQFPSIWNNRVMRAVQHFYLERTGADFDAMLKDITAHPMAHGFTHRDMIRLGHPKPVKPGSGEKYVVMYYAKGIEKCRASEEFKEGCPNVVEYFEAFQSLKKSETPLDARAIAEAHGFSFDHLPTKFSWDKEVWKYLVETESIRKILELLRPLLVNKVFGLESVLGLRFLERVSDTKEVLPLFGGVGPNGKTLLVEKRIHPIKAYEMWKEFHHPDQELAAKQSRLTKKDLISDRQLRVVNRLPILCPYISDALKRLLQTSIESVPPTGKKWLVVIDRSPKVHEHECSYMNDIKASDAIAILTLSILKSEPAGKVHVVHFTRGGFAPSTDFTRDLSLEEALVVMKNPVEHGKANVKQLLEYASDNVVPYDAILVLSYTFSFSLALKEEEDASKTVSFIKELEEYCQQKNTDLRLTICGLAEKKLKLDVEKSPRVLYVAGMDHLAPWVIRSFAAKSF